MVAATTSACARGTAAPERPRPAAPAPVVVVDTPSIAAPWVVRRTAVPHEHRILVTATLESRVDTTTRTDTVRSELVATWQGPGADNVWPRRFAGTLDDYRTGSGADSLAGVGGLALPLPFSALQRSPSVQPEFTAPDAAACGDAGGGLVQGVRDLWIALPDTLRPGATWRDSSTYVLCRDSIPLHVTVVRAFEVAGAASLGADGIVATIVRRTTSRLRGTGTQFGDPVTIEGQGEGLMMFEVAIAGGRVRGASGDAVLTLTLRGSRRSQELTQRSRTEILER